MLIGSALRRYWCEGKCSIRSGRSTSTTSCTSRTWTTAAGRADRVGAFAMRRALTSYIFEAGVRRSSSASRRGPGCPPITGLPAIATSPSSTAVALARLRPTLRGSLVVGSRSCARLWARRCPTSQIGRAGASGSVGMARLRNSKLRAKATSDAAGQTADRVLRQRATGRRTADRRRDSVAPVDRAPG